MSTTADEGEHDNGKVNRIGNKAFLLDNIIITEIDFKNEKTQGDVVSQTISTKTNTICCVRQVDKQMFGVYNMPIKTRCGIFCWYKENKYGK